MRGLFNRIDAGVTEPVDDVESVIDHLRCILNTARGSASASPELGMPALCDIVHSFPDALPTIQRAIRDAIAQFEPRLRSVSVRMLPARSPAELDFEVVGRVGAGPESRPLRLQTRISRSHVIVT